MSRLWVWWSIGVFLLGGAVGYWLHHAPPLPAPIAHVVHEAARRDTIYLHTRDTLIQQMTQYDTVRSTLNIHDTVAVTQYVAVADTTIALCARALGACDSTRTAQRRVIDAALANQPSRWSQVTTALTWLAIGVAIDRTPSLLHH